MNEWQAIPKSYKSAWLVLLAGLLTTGYAGHAVKSEIDLDAQRQFASDCQGVKLRIEARLQAHKLVLLGGAALFDASDHVGRDDWRTYANRVEIDQHFNGIQGLGFSLLIPKGRLNRHIAEIRSQGFPEYTVRPAGERDTYSSIIYLEPFKERNLRAFGYDMYSEPVRRAAMEQARDENVVALSGKVVLVQETDKDVQAGTLMYVPVYRKQMPIETVEQRRAALYGWVYSPFRMGDLLHGVLRGWDDPKGSHLRLQVYDGRTINADSLLYRSDAGQSKVSTPAALRHVEQRMDFNGREWTLHFEQLKGSVSRTDYGVVWAILAGGAGLSILSFLLMLSYLNTRRDAVRIADELTSELRKASGYARSLLEASLDPLVTISPEGKITDVNQATEKVTGRSRSELIGTDFSDYFTEPDRARKGYRQVFLEGSVTDYPLAIRHCDGRITDVLYNASVYRDATGEVLGVFAAARDITERKRIEERLRRSEYSMREAQRIGHLGSWDLDLAKGELNWSDEIYRIFELDPGKFDPSYEAFLNAIHPDDREMVDRAYAESVSNKLPYSIEHRLLMKDGRVKYVNERCETYYGEDGKPLRSFGTVHDITERKRAEEELRISEERLALAVSTGGVGIWDWDIVENKLVWDDSMYRLYGLRHGDFGGAYEAWESTLHPEDKAHVNEEIQAALRGEREYAPEFRVIWPDGSIHHLKSASHTLFDDKGNPLRMVGINYDLTERKQVEEALARHVRDLGERIKEIECLRDIIGLLLDKDRNMEQVLDACVRRLPMAWLDPAHTCARIRMGGQVYESAGFQESGWKLEAAIHALGAESGLVEIFYFGKDPGDGESPFLSEEHALIESIAIQIAQSLEKRQAEVALQQNQAELQEAQRIAHVGSWRLDVATNHVVWSEELYRMYGLSPESPPPDYPEHRKLFSPESWERLNTAITRIRETGMSYELELETVRTDGSHGWMLARGEAKRDADGAIVALHGVALDITGRKNAEIVLRDALMKVRRFSDALDSIESSCVYMKDMNHQYFYGNKSTLKLFNCSAEELAGSSDAKFFPHEAVDRLKAVDDRVLGRGETTMEEIDVSPGSPERRVYLEVKTPIYDDAGKIIGLCGISTDITERKLIEEKIRQLNSELEQRVEERTAKLKAANQEMEAFAYSVSHDLRVPLRAIDGFSHILLEHHESSLDGEGKRLLHIVRDNTKKMSQLIDDILAFSRMGRLEIKIAKTDMEALAREVWQELEPSCAGRDVQMEIKPLPGVQGDASMLHQVWANLLGNAVKFTKNRASARIEIGSSVQGGENVFYVKDNGAGFDMQYADKLFGVFQRLHGIEEFEGTGIGLAIVKRIITRHGGRVWAEGKVNEGAVIYFALPQKMQQ